MNGHDRRNRRPSAGRRFGYVMAMAVNALLLVVVHNVFDWGWFGFLTADYDRVRPLLELSMVASIAVNAVYVLEDTAAWKAAGGLLTSAISVGVAVRFLRVFPFDFADYDRDWSWLARTVLVIGLVGSAIAVLANAVSYLRALVDRGGDRQR